MHSDYPDILGIAKLAGIEVQWWDENGVPRFEKHSPCLCPDIYATEVALLMIACQACAMEFLVQMSHGPMDMVRAMMRRSAGVTTDPPTLADAVRGGGIHYGDPPHHDGCPAGCTMNVYDLRVIEFWRHDASTNYKWVRFPELELELPDAKDPNRE